MDDAFQSRTAASANRSRFHAPAVLCGAGGEDIVGGHGPALARGGHALADPLDLPGIRGQLLFDRLISDELRQRSMAAASASISATRAVRMVMGSHRCRINCVFYCAHVNLARGDRAPDGYRRLPRFSAARRRWRLLASLRRGASPARRGGVGILRPSISSSSKSSPPVIGAASTRRT